MFGKVGFSTTELTNVTDIIKMTELKIYRIKKRKLAFFTV